jgi:hypothetical protein
MCFDSALETQWAHMCGFGFSHMNKYASHVAELAPVLERLKRFKTFK